LIYIKIKIKHLTIIKAYQLEKFMPIKLLLCLIIPFNLQALSPEAENGKEVIATCLACHNAEIIPALAPPLYGIQKKYKQVYGEKKAFIQAVSNWTKKPSVEKSIMKRPLKMLGLMPAMSLPNNMLTNIGAYLYEENFPPPCFHWSNELNKSNDQSGGKGQGGNHQAMIKMKYDQLCK
jgi:hypothetical protein